MTAEPTDPNAAAGPSGTPPAVPPPLPEFSAQAVARRPAAGIEAADGEPMPVLEAFQKFLDAERRRARNRMLMLSAAFAGVLLIVIAGGIAAALSLMRPMQAGLVALRQDISGSERRAVRAARKVELAVEQAGQRDRRLREDLGRDRQSTAEAQAALKDQADAMKTDVDRTREMLRQLQADNLRLREEVLRGQAAAAALTPPAREPSQAVAGADVGPEIPPATPLVRRGPRRFELSITPAGSDDGVPWRVSVPE
jgi:hypothetical protein